MDHFAAGSTPISEAERDESPKAFERALERLKEATKRHGMQRYQRPLSEDERRGMLRLLGRMLGETED